MKLEIKHDRWMLKSHDGSLFHKPTTILCTDRDRTTSLDNYPHEYITTIKKDSNAVVVNRYSDYGTAIIEHRITSAMLGLKKVKWYHR